jgi:hypothetical protein
VTQYTTQALLPQIARCIDDIVYENYTVPVQVNEFKLLASDFPSALNDYDASAFVLKDTLTLDDVQRLQTINGMCSAYMQTGEMRLSALRKALTPAQYTGVITAFKTLEHPEEHMYGAGIPFVLKDFNRKLREADMKFGQFERLSNRRSAGITKRKRGSLSVMEDKSESLYEDAIERLMEIFTSAQHGDYGMDMYGQILTWMDRDVDFTNEGDLSIDCEGVPRVRGSKSQFARNAGLPKLHKRLKRNECALKALLVAGCEIAFVFPEVQVDPAVVAAQSQTLKQMMGKLRNARD